jgi:predicted Fe-Mo cluster-binding NifX family protein
MKIAVTSQGTEKNSPLDPRFGRTKYFVVYDTDTLTYSAHDNVRNLSAAQGAGIQSAGTIDRLGCKAVVTGHCGPKAFAALTKAGIAVYAAASGTVYEAVESFNQGALKKIETADVDGHW